MPHKSSCTGARLRALQADDEDGTVALDHEEFPRPQTTAEQLAGLKPSFDAVADASIVMPTVADRTAATTQ